MTSPTTRQFIKNVSKTENQPKASLNPLEPSFFTVKNFSEKILSENTLRYGLYLVNTSKNNISLGFGTKAVLDSGITLVPNAVWCMNESSFYTGDINAISTRLTGGSNLSIQEFTI